MGAISGIWIVTPQRHDKLVTKAVGIIQSFVLYFVLSKIEYRIYDFILSLVSHYFLMKNLSAVWSFFSSLWFVFFLSHASQLLTTSEHTGLRQSIESWQPRTESPHLLRPQGLKKVLQERGFRQTTVCCARCRQPHARVSDMRVIIYRRSGRLSEP